MIVAGDAEDGTVCHALYIWNDRMYSTSRCSPRGFPRSEAFLPARPVRGIPGCSSPPSDCAAAARCSWPPTRRPKGREEWDSVFQAVRPIACSSWRDTCPRGVLMISCTQPFLMMSMMFSVPSLAFSTGRFRCRGTSQEPRDVPSVAMILNPSRRYDPDDRGRPVGLVVVVQADEDRPFLRSVLPAAMRGLREGNAEAVGDPHHLAGGPHLRTEEVAGMRELRERKDRLLDGNVFRPAVAGRPVPGGSAPPSASRRSWPAARRSPC